MAGDFEQQVDLRASGSAVKERDGTLGGGSDEILDDEAFPGLADDGVSEDIGVCFEAEEGMEEAAVPDVDLGRFDEAFAEICMEGVEAADEQEV